MSFLETPRFPIDISYGAVGGPGYLTEVVVLGSGFESRNQRWSTARGSWDVAKACKNDALRKKLITFFRIVKGRTHGFRFRDFSDYKVESGEGFLVSLGSEQYQLVRHYVNEGGTDVRTITKPVPNKTTIFDGATALVPGADYTIDTATGIITMLNSPPATPDSWVGEFDVPCRFDTDTLKLVIEDINFFRSQTINIVEIRV